MGLGDAVELTVVLRHLRHYHPGCRIELVITPGREALYRGWAEEIASEPDLRRPPTHKLFWPQPRRSHAAVPSTCAVNSVIKDFGLAPIPELCRSLVHSTAGQVEHARAWLSTLSVGNAEPPKTWRAVPPGGSPSLASDLRPPTSPKYALCHFRGASFPREKNLDDYQAAAIASVLADAGYTVLIWDSNERTKLPEQGLGLRVPDGPPLFRLVGTDNQPAWKKPLDVSGMIGLLRAVDLFVGVDSGPLHLAGALGVRAIGLWKKHSPLHCIAPAERMTHLCHTNGVPHYERFLAHHPIDDGVAYLRANYRVRWCDDHARALAELLSEER